MLVRRHPDSFGIAPASVLVGPPLLTTGNLASGILRDNTPSRAMGVKCTNLASPHYVQYKHAQYFSFGIQALYHGLIPECIFKLPTFRHCNTEFRGGGDIISLPRVDTASYGLHSLSYYGSKLSNSRPEPIRIIPELRKFKALFQTSVLVVTAAPIYLSIFTDI